MIATLNSLPARSLGSRPAIAEMPLGPAVRRLAIRLIFLAYGLFLIEGALRKWAFPEFQQALFLLRDPIVFLIYALSLPLLLAPPLAFLIWLVFASLAVLFSGLGHVLHGNGVLAWWFRRA
jgi:hypothetical protein